MMTIADDITILGSALKAQLETPQSEMIEIIQRILFHSQNVDVRRSDISDFFMLLFQGLDAATQRQQIQVPDELLPDLPAMPEGSSDVVRAVPDEPTTSFSGITEGVDNAGMSGSEPHEFDFACLLENPGRLLTGRRPSMLRMPDGSQVTVGSWRQVADHAIKWMAEHRPRPDLPFRVRPYGNNFFLNSQPQHVQQPMRSTSEVRWGDSMVYAELHQSARDLMIAVCKLGAALGLSADSFHVTYADNTGYSAEEGEPAHNLGLKLVAILRRLSMPSHYQRVADELNDENPDAPVSITTVRATLGAYKDLFANLGNGVYGLKEWGVTDQQSRKREGEAISTLIVNLLEEEDTPLDFKTIVSRVMAVKSCQETSIRGCLANDGRFHAFGGGRYGLKKWIV